MGKVVVVTGGSRGIGRATVMLAAARGYDIAFSYASNAAAATEVSNAVASKDRLVRAVKGDVGKEEDVFSLFQAADALGQIVGLVNNAGVVDRTQRVDEMSMARLTRMFMINVVGSFVAAREAIKRMSTRHGGSGGAIVNLSSLAAQLGAANTYVDYAASKGAIETFTLGLAREVAAEGIRVNAVAPGIIDTEIHASGGNPDRAAQMAGTVPMQRAGTADEVAAAILWLLSDEASYTTGTVLTVSGGR
ncbi:MAG: SDR family oxidoreductase [Methylobacteriaceae bacterium]|nr:SDR family oxidoreductase [Methylobacteriaceae bacterium]